ncbi:hypothetical protein D9757_007087 [Collybiopsis confluens]|uniref:Uncharacterized protein n=1 Tax=Collybiopsis confluens TaxID=2823264 RepID=A0A8H5HCG2_9AGAR|nr:hypothetical protein D9757_007087 [Collybiopsis confluens]
MAVTTRAQAKRISAAFDLLKTPKSSGRRASRRRQLPVTPERRARQTPKSARIRQPRTPATRKDNKPRTPTNKRREPATDEASPVAPASSSGVVPSSSALQIVASSDGWVKCGNSLRRESDARLTSQYEQRQQASLVQRSEDVFNTHAERLIEQYNSTYQWYDRMMTEGLQNAQVSASAAGGGLGPLGPIAEDEEDRMTEVDGEELSREDSLMDNGETSAAEFVAGSSSSDSLMDNGETSTVAGSSGISSKSLATPIAPGERLFPKQFQDCPPGVRISLFHSPTKILDEDEDDN